MREPNERASRNSRSFHRTKQWRSAKEKQRGNTGYLPRKSSLVFDDVSFGAWNRLNFKSTRCLEHFEMNTRPCYMYKRFETSRKYYETNDDVEKEIYSETSGGGPIEGNDIDDETNVRNRNGIEDMEIEIVEDLV